MRPRISLSLTGIGWAMILGSLFLYSSARSNDNNLLYLIGAALLAIVLSHFLAGWRNLNGLSVAWRPPDEGFVGATLSPLLEVFDVGQRSHFQLSVDYEYLEHLPARQSFSFKTHTRLERRGRLSLDTLQLTSLYPFGLCRFTLHLPSVTLWAYPHPAEGQITGVQESMLANRQPSVDAMGDYWMLREYREGEDARQINWRSSAKTDAEWVMVLAQPRQEPFRIWLDFRGLADDLLEPFLQRVSGLILRVAESPLALQLWVSGCREQPSPGWVDLREGPNRRIAWRWLAGLSSEDADRAVAPDPQGGYALKAGHFQP